MTDVFLINFRNEREMYPPFGIMYVADALEKQGVSVELWHETRPTPDGKWMIDHFHRTIQLDGDLTEEQRLRLLEIAERCPVSQTLRRSSTIDSRLADAAEPIAALARH